MTVFTWFEVQDKEISDLVKSLDSNKANGADNISVKVLKLIFYEKSKKFTIIIYGVIITP